MLFNRYSRLTGTHAFLSGSKYHWINYDEDKLERVFASTQAAQRGTELHAFAAEAIRLGRTLTRNSETVNAFVNDAIGFKMTPEPIFYYSDNFYGAPDAAGFRKNKLRIHDLKTGVTQTSFHQIDVYGALFCLEYKMKPFDIEMEWRIYQNDDVRVHIPDPVDISAIMEKGKRFDRIINNMRLEAM